MVVSQWKLQRNETIEHSIITIGKTRKMKRDLDQIWRQTSRLENSFHRAMRELIRLQKARKQESRAESATRVNPQAVGNKPRMAPIVPVPRTQPQAPYIMSEPVAEPDRPAGWTVMAGVDPALCVDRKSSGKLREEGTLE
ncbi:MAG: hypothetical protein U0Q18_29730 [Bryobacteraceae bacterium]